jgi:DNA-binding NarL/FixJ family response regulator
MPDGFARNVVSVLQEAGSGAASGLALLTEREREILACAASGRGNKDIAEQLYVSLDTVKTHLHHIYRKLGVDGRVEAILTYLNTK